MAKKKQEEKADVLEEINGLFGKGIIQLLGTAPTHQYEVVSTGSINLDKALGIGGLPRGRVVEIYGPESSGKTTIALQVIANAQAKGLACGFIDAEHALDTNYAKALGVQLEVLAVTQPDYGEQALQITDMLVRSGRFAVLVIDSVAALIPKAELEGNMEDMQVGAQARMMSKALRKIVSAANVNDTLVIFINQTRSKIGGMGNPETTPGGAALKFAASVRMRVVRTGSTKAQGLAVANTTKVKVVKNKVAPPFKEAEFEIEFGKGVSLAGELVDFGLKEGLVLKSGAWLKLADGTALGHGREQAKTCIQDNPELMQKLLAAISTT